MSAKNNGERWFVVHDFPTGEVNGRIYPGHHIKVDDLAKTPVCVVLVTNPKDAKHVAARRRMADLAAAAPELLDLVEAMISEEPCEFDRNGNCQAHNHFDGQECPQSAAKSLLRRLGSRKGRRAD